MPRARRPGGAQPAARPRGAQPAARAHACPHESRAASARPHATRCPSSRPLPPRMSPTVGRRAAPQHPTEPRPSNIWSPTPRRTHASPPCSASLVSRSAAASRPGAVESWHCAAAARERTSTDSKTRDSATATAWERLREGHGPAPQRAKGVRLGAHGCAVRSPLRVRPMLRAMRVCSKAAQTGVQEKTAERWARREAGEPPARTIVEDEHDRDGEARDCFDGFGGKT